MSFVRTGYGLARSAHNVPAWIDAWVWRSDAWYLRVLRRAQGAWTTHLESPEGYLRTRIFEPSSPGLSILGTENRRIDVPDASQLAPLIQPRDVLGRLLPGAKTASHDLFVTDTADGPVFLPALLLLTHLWCWSRNALVALLTPNSLDLYLEHVDGHDGVEPSCIARSFLAGRTPAAETQMRLAWLATSLAARESWASVWSSAHVGRITLQLPPAALSAWAWGVNVPGGLLACELGSVAIRPLANDQLPSVRVVA